MKSQAGCHLGGGGVGAQAPPPKHTQTFPHIINVKYCVSVAIVWVNNDTSLTLSQQTQSVLLETYRIYSLP